MSKYCVHGNGETITGFRSLVGARDYILERDIKTFSIWRFRDWWFFKHWIFVESWPLKFGQKLKWYPPGFYTGLPKGFQHCQAPRANSGRSKAWEAA